MKIEHLDDGHSGESEGEGSRRANGRGHDGEDGHRKKRTKRSSGKACVYCRRSHMVCEGGRPCERCIRREIAHLCRDVSPQARRPSSPSQDRTVSPQHQPPADTPSQQSEPVTSLPNTLYSDPNFPPAWPLLPDTAGPVSFGTQANGNTVEKTSSGPYSARNDDMTEFGALTKFMGDLGAPHVPGGLLDMLAFISRGGSLNNNNTFSDGALEEPIETPQVESGPSTGVTSRETYAPFNLPRSEPLSRSGNNSGKGKGKETNTPLAGISRMERYFLAAADQPSGPRASRLAQVIKAKYDAGLLKPYDYIKGYERMNKWMDSGRAAPKADSVAGSAPSSPQKNGGSRNRPSVTPILGPKYGSSISAESRRRILTALNGFRPKFRQIAQTLTDVDLVFVEEAMERWMLEYDRLFASIHTPSCIWRRTGEIQKANQEFANVTGIPASMFRGGQLCVYELMDEDSAVRYWERYAKIAFDSGQRSLTTSCILKIPVSLTRSRWVRSSATPLSHNGKLAASTNVDFALPQPMISDRPGGDVGSGVASDTGIEDYRLIKCCFSVTIRRDAWGVPVAIMGQWIPI
ncbi:hypothetical protein BD324DRAFT_639734 [Kockovaella imperatae]|uniref:Zn(2)-C6 fungal-type domain-containing protein n=1 Tax=Kockovaella imperatae TaxID=4999 RepID=A0A1Y1U8I1_9TREE|nr:hypothetical protein BD324DRAFT_639734 [Kockovaella imperatae]ORX33425.1 hypothetical protein BD324DRAFT_639734 [Kockovaella imperatae]